MAKPKSKDTKDATKPAPPKKLTPFRTLSEGDRFHACGGTWVKQATDWAKHETDPEKGQLFYPQALVERAVEETEEGE